MGSLKNRSLILALSRASNHAVLLFSPILLVRILDVEDYGQYREFVLYAMLLKELVALSASRSLLYFIPLRPAEETRFVSQSLLFTFVLSSIGCGLVWAAGDVIRSYTSVDFVMPLVLYLFFFINMDYFESYWLAKKRSDVVLYYSALRVLLRLTVVIVVAYRTHDPVQIAYAMALFEAVRMLLVLAFTWRHKLLGGSIEWKSCKEQMAYFLPVGGASMLYALNENVSRLFVSTQLGVEALSLYVVGAYAMPLLKIARGSLSDVIFPNMVEESQHADSHNKLRLWQQTTLLLCLLLFPAATVLIGWADVIIRLLFTADYAAAAPIFTIYALVLMRDCFDLTLPLRVAGKTGQFLLTNVVGIVVNLALLFPFYSWFGLLGPAFAYLATRLVTAVAFSAVIVHAYNIRISGMLPWRDLAHIVVACAVMSPLMFVLVPLELPGIARAAGGAVLFVLGYILFIRRYGSPTIIRFIDRLSPNLVRKANSVTRT